MAQTILVVDDDPVQRRLLEAAISRSGMQVVTAPGGQPALDLINGPRGDQITLMLLDGSLVLEPAQHLPQGRPIRVLQPERTRDLAHAGFALVRADEGEDVFAGGKAGRPGFLGGFLQDDGTVGPPRRNRQPGIIRPP